MTGPVGSACADDDAPDDISDVAVLLAPEPAVSEPADDGAKLEAPELAPLIAELAPLIAELAPDIAELAPLIAELAPDIAELAPPAGELAVEPPADTAAEVGAAEVFEPPPLVPQALNTRATTAVPARAAMRSRREPLRSTRTVITILVSRSPAVCGP